jgi:A/G-specific adenine glycosylase
MDTLDTIADFPDLSGHLLPDGALSEAGIRAFREQIWHFYSQHERAFPWRQTRDAYQIFVSEVMLQQTQTDRVWEKYLEFVALFPDFQALACASLHDVLSAWQGLGYNRRGRFLHESAQKVMQEHGGRLPASEEILGTFPGIGPATAASICAFAFDMPTVFIETNIRTVFIVSFLRAQREIPDAAIRTLVAQTVDPEHPRLWYYALMDYGVTLKKTLGNANKQSKHYARQSKFEGSNRQVRGMVLRVLLKHRQVSFTDLCSELTNELSVAPERLQAVVDQLCVERLVKKQDDILVI